MKLTDLDAQFVHDAKPDFSYRISDAFHGAQGVLFQCPACAVGKEVGEEDGRRHAKGAHYIRIMFANPTGAPVADADCDPNPRWTVSGSGIADLTLSPSVNLDVGGDGCRWHGWVTNGEAA